MKRSLFALLITLAVILSACGSGDVYARAYTASGDSTNANDLSRSEQFRGTDDINVVVILNNRNSDTDVEVRFFYGPEKLQWGESIKVNVKENVGTVVLGLDHENKGDTEEWPGGGWRADIYIDGERVDQLDFRVTG